MVHQFFGISFFTVYRIKIQWSFFRSGTLRVLRHRLTALESEAQSLTGNEKSRERSNEQVPGDHVTGAVDGRVTAGEARRQAAAVDDPRASPAAGRRRRLVARRSPTVVAVDRRGSVVVVVRMM